MLSNFEIFDFLLFFLGTRMSSLKRREFFVNYLVQFFASHVKWCKPSPQPDHVSILLPRSSEWWHPQLSRSKRNNDEGDCVWLHVTGMWNHPTWNFGEAFSFRPRGSFMCVLGLPPDQPPCLMARHSDLAQIDHSSPLEHFHAWAFQHFTSSPFPCYFTLQVPLRLAMEQLIDFLLLFDPSSSSSHTQNLHPFVHDYCHFFRFFRLPHSSESLISWISNSDVCLSLSPLLIIFHFLQILIYRDILVWSPQLEIDPHQINPSFPL